MDLEEWEILSNEDNISPKFTIKTNNNNSNNYNIINNDYFQEKNSDHEEKNSDHQEIISKELLSNNNNDSLENQFVDMKEVKDGNFTVKKIEEDEKMIVYEEKEVKNEKEGEKMVEYDGELSEKVLNSCMGRDGIEKEKDGENGAVKIWKWAMSGMGALVTFGFTAVTISLVVFNSQHNKDGNNSKDKKDLHFQIFPHDKRFKQVVRRAQRLNEAISVMRGAPITTAHITIGGYHEGL